MLKQLNGALEKWMRWMRLQEAISWAGRGLIVGMTLALAAGVPALLGARLLPAEFLAGAAALAVGGALAGGATASLRRRDRLEAARRCDRIFDLAERVSTALETNEARRASSRLLQQQLADAAAAAASVDAARQLPLRLARTEGLVALALCLLIGLVWWRGEPWFQAAARKRAVQAAVQEQAAQIEQLLTQIQESQILTEAQQEALSHPLEEALEALGSDPSLEGSVSVLTSTAEQLEALPDPQAEAAAQALQQAGSQLSAQEGSPLETAGQELAEGDILNAAAELANLDPGQLSPSEAAQAADQLQALAESLAEANPQLAAQLQQAAEALQAGDAAAAGQALQAAAQQLAQAGQQAAFSQAAGQAAGQLQQGAGQVLAAGGGAPPGQDGQPGSGQGGQAGSGQEGQPGAGQGGETNAGGGAGSGSGEGTQPAGPGGEAGSSPIPQGNDPAEGGPGAYEQIYAPTLLDGEGGPEVGLPGSGADGPVVGQGPHDPSEAGQSLVPYQDVYAQYDALNQRAIESGQVPIEFLEVVRRYFDSVKP
jgi:hypothetical protein